MAYQRVEILTGSERRWNYTPAEKVRIVEEAFRPGVIVKDVARRLGIHESLLYRWRRADEGGGFDRWAPDLCAGDGNAGAGRGNRRPCPRDVATGDTGRRRRGGSHFSISADCGSVRDRGEISHCTRVCELGRGEFANDRPFWMVSTRSESALMKSRFCSTQDRRSGGVASARASRRSLDHRRLDPLRRLVEQQEPAPAPASGERKSCCSPPTARHPAAR